MPGVPRYIQKLVKEKSKTKASYRAKISSLSYLQQNERTRTNTVNSIERCSSYEFRTRGFTHDKLVACEEDSVFVDGLHNNNNEDMTTGKRKKIRFSTNVSDGDRFRHDKATAKYLQTLAHFGQWDEFARTLKEAQNSGFSKNSVRFSTASSSHSATKNSDMEDNSNGKQTILRRFMEMFPKLKTLEVDQDFFQIVILLTTLELPYFIARVVFTIKYSVSSTTMVFYTTKNVVMVIFLVYRMWVKFSGDETAREEDDCDDDEDNEYSRDVMNLKWTNLIYTYLLVKNLLRSLHTQPTYDFETTFYERWSDVKTFKRFIRNLSRVY